MREEARRRLAYAIARAAGRTRTTIFTYETGKFTHMSGGPSSFFDYDTSTHFTDRFDYQTGSHWSFRVDRERFAGFNYGEGHHFSGNIQGSTINLFDYGSGSWHRYLV
jgi:hypothetical protein